MERTNSNRIVGLDHHQQLRLLPFASIWHFNLEGIITLCFFPILFNLRQCRVKIFSKVVTFISLISYSMYLVNFELVQKTLLSFTESQFMELYSLNSYLRYITYLGFTLIISYGLYIFIEKPFMILRSKI
jgi:peptidoglycan/LPS O-acetylase OafA/YrhL